MNIVVLVKVVPDTYGARRMDPAAGRVERNADGAVIDEIDERALELALTLREAAGAGEVSLISMGPAHLTATLRKGLAMGADRATQVIDKRLAGADLASIPFS